MLNPQLSLSNSSLTDLDLSCFEGKETEQNWEQRDKLFKGLIDHYNSFEEGQPVTSKLPQLLACLHTPRTQLMSSACMFVQCIAQHSTMSDSQQELVLSNMIKLMSSTKRIAANAAVSAAKPICHLMKIDRLLSILLQGFLDKNASLRARLMELVEEIFMDAYTNEMFATIMKRAIVDANPEVRQRAGKIFQSIETSDPPWAETFYDSLDASCRKQLVQLKGKHIKDVQATAKPDLLSIISQRKAGIIQNFEGPSHPSTEEHAQPEPLPMKQPSEETDDEVILRIRHSAIRPVVDALPRLSIDDIEPPDENVPEVEMTPIDTSSSTKKHPDNYSILLGSPRRRIESLGLAMSTPMRRILDEGNSGRSAQKRSSPLPLSIFELLMRRVEEDTPSRLSSLHKLSLMTTKNVNDGTEMNSIWNAKNLNTFLTVLDKIIRSFDRSVLESYFYFS